MCCGFGAVILLVLILSGRVQQKREDHTRDLEKELARATALYKAARAGARPAAAEAATARDARTQLDRPPEAAAAKAEPQAPRPPDPSGAATEAQLNQIGERLRQTQEEIAAATAAARQTAKAVEALERETSALRNATKLLEGRKIAVAPGDRPVGFRGDGQRQYLSGLKLGGDRTLILVDASASMLDELIVNIVRRKLTGAAARREAPKWVRAVRAAHWLVANLQANKRFQVYVFNTEAQPAIAGTDHQWLSTSDASQLTDTITALRDVAPEGGTNLHRALAVARRLNPTPDSIILLTDGLPTQGGPSARVNTISSDDRLKLFESAMAQLPPGIPVNTFLFPIEGDPAAAEAFWRLAIATQGSFITPSRSWP
jgi:hypothetical protein